MKNIKNRILLLITVAMILSLVSGCDNKTVKDSYENRLFDQSYVHEVDIHISEEDWADLLNDPASKTKYKVDIIVDGEEFKEVSCSTKGNSSLYFVAANEDSDRYSFKINFSKNNKDQTYHGLKTINLGNIYSDPSYLKDFMSYEIFKKAGVNVPLVSYTWVKINGEDHGLYLASEDMADSFIKRNYQGKGVLYKPENDELELDMDQIAQIQQNGLEYPSGSKGADFIYIDDDPESYPDIFENAESKMEEADKIRVIEALKGLASGKDLEQYLDTDELIRYFVAHVFLMNYDSYTGPMLHNYYLYENNGRLSLIPWDYNSAFATFKLVLTEETLNDPTAFINSGIDTPLILTDKEDRPMWKWIVEDEEYTRKYHEQFRKLIDEYFVSGEFVSRTDEVYKLIEPYISKDPTAFYTIDQSRKAYQTLKDFCLTRSESILKQLDGSLSSENDKQDPADYVDAKDIHILDMR